MGTVYEATHPIIGKQVAIKVVNRELTYVAEAHERCLGEARALTQIDHPNIVDVYSFGQLEDGRAYLVMELLEGRSLAALIDSEHLDLVDIVSILEQTCSALAACHQAGIVHRDLKPDNVYVSGRGSDLQIKLFDFGIAKADGLGLVPGLTGQGQIVGTPEYMAPEQARGLDIDGRCDLYQLGVLAYECIAGDVPFEGPSSVDTLAALLTETPTPLSEIAHQIPFDLERLIDGLMARDRDDRPAASEAIETLAAVREQLTTVVTPVPTPTPEPRRSRSWQVVPLALIVAGLSLAWLALAADRVATTAGAVIELPETLAEAELVNDELVAAEPAPRPAVAPEPDDSEHQVGIAAKPARRANTPIERRAWRSHRARPRPQPQRRDPDALMDPFDKGAP